MPHVLAEHLPEKWFMEFQRYAARKLLPQRRSDLYLAQLALVMAKTAGNKDVTLQDFLFEIEEEDDSVEAALEFFGGAERVK